MNRGMPVLLMVLMFLLVVTCYFDRTVVSIAAPAIMKEFSLSETGMGTVFSAFLFTYAALMIPGGWFTDRYGPRLALAFVAIGSGIAVALLVIVGTPGLGIIATFVVLRAFFGVTQAPTFPAVNRANAEWSAAHQRSFVQAVVASGAGLGSALSPILCVPLVENFGWRSAFLLAGAVSVLFGIVWYTLARDNRSASAATPKVDWRALFSNRNLILITIGFTALDYFEYIFFYWTFYYFDQIRKLPKAESAGYTTALYLTWLVLTPFGGKLSDWLVAKYGATNGLRAAAMGFLGLSAVLLFFGARTEATLPAVVLICLAFGFASCADVNFWAASIEFAGDQAGAAGGIMNAGGNLGGAIAPVLTPIIAAQWGWSWGLYFGSFMALVGVAVWIWVTPPPSARPRTGSPQPSRP